MSSRAAALSFQVPGKSAKQLEDWAKQHRYDEWAKLAGAKDRYTWMKLVENAQQEMREEAGIEGDEKEEAAEKRVTGKRKSRLSSGYEGGVKPAPASPRVRAKRKSRGRGADADSAYEESDNESRSVAHVSSSDDASVASSATPTKKRARTTTAAAASRRKSTSSKPKGKARASHVSEEEEEEVESHAEPHDASGDVDMAAASSKASSPPAPTFFDSSLLQSSTDADVEMRPASSPPVSDKFSISNSPAPAVPNPFQRSPNVQATSPEPAAATATARSTLAPPSFANETSFVQQRRAKSLAPTSSSFQGSRAVDDAPLRLQPIPSIPSPASSPFSEPPETPIEAFKTPALPPNATQDQIHDLLGQTFKLPANLRKSAPPNFMSSSSFLADRAPFDEGLRHRFSAQPVPPIEEKYSSVMPSVDERDRDSIAVEPEEEEVQVEVPVPVQVQEEEEEETSPERVQPSRRRRYTDKVTGIVPEPALTAPKPSFIARVRHFFASLVRFLLRTTLISLIVVTVWLLVQDGRLLALFTGPTVSNTVFCPSDPNEARPLHSTLPKGQLQCAPCPKEAFCTEGRMECLSPDTYVREGDKCVLNNEAHQRAYYIKETAIGILERRLGDAECGYLPSDASAALDVLELKREVEAETASVIPEMSYEQLWHVGQSMMLKESGLPSQRDLPGVRVLSMPVQPRALTQFQAVKPQTRLVCQLRRLVHAHILHIAAVSVLISIATYLWFLFRRWQYRRALVPAYCSLIRGRLQSCAELEKPFAVAHLHEEFVSSHPRAGDDAWRSIVTTLNKDTRIQKSRDQFGEVMRDSWMWTGPIEQR